MHNGLHDADPDALVIRELSRLASLAPSPGFSDRVMARVRLPQPKAVVAFNRAKSWAMEPRRALALAGGYALTATAALVLLLPWLIRNSAAVRFGADWVTTQVFGALRDWMLAAATWTVSTGVVDWLQSLEVGGGQLVAAGIAITAGYATCAACLHFLLRAPRGANVPAHVSY